MKIEPTELIQVIDAGKNTFEINYMMRELAAAKRSFAATFDEEGNCTICAPKIGDRNPKHPQPTDPLSEAIAA